MGQTDVATGKDGAGCYQGVKKVVRKACLDSEVDFDKMWAKICFSVTDGASAMRSTPLYAGLDAKEDGESFVSQFKKDGKPNMATFIVYVIISIWHSKMRLNIPDRIGPMTG